MHRKYNQDSDDCFHFRECRSQESLSALPPCVKRELNAEWIEPIKGFISRYLPVVTETCSHPTVCTSVVIGFDL